MKNIRRSNDQNSSKENCPTKRNIPYNQAGDFIQLTIVYNISAKAICEANPGLSAENFRIGQVIRIPSAEAAQATADSQEPNNADTEKQPIRFKALFSPDAKRCTK